MNKEEIMLQKRFVDLSNLAYHKGIPVFTDFLSMNEQSILHNTKKNELSTSYHMFGGYEFAERQMAMFVPDALFHSMEDADTQMQYAHSYPIQVLEVKPKYPKFADKLTHRDYLGALISLGVDRCKIGDILVKENKAFFFCHEKMADYFMEELTQIKHTQVEVREADEEAFLFQPEFQEIKGTVSSLRIDSLVALVLKQSRSSILDLFRAQKIFVNGKLIESNSHVVKEDDIITIRGAGRFVFKEVLSTTKKDRLYVLLLKYV